MICRLSSETDMMEVPVDDGVVLMSTLSCSISVISILITSSSFKYQSSKPTLYPYNTFWY